MAKKNFNTLTGIGTKVALTAAMAAALAISTNAEELEGTPAPAPAPEPAPVVDAAPAPAPVAEAPAPVAPAEVPAVNESIAESNTETAGGNTETAGGNAGIVESNSGAVAENTESTGGELAAPELPALPEAPDVPETPNFENQTTEEKNEQVDGYNDAVGQYNDKVDDYNDAATDYNTKVDGYNDAADTYDKNAAKEYQDHQQEKDTYENAYQEYLNKDNALRQEHEAKEDQAAIDHKAEQDRLVTEDQKKKEQAWIDHIAAEDEARKQHEANELEAARNAHEAEQNELEKQFDEEELARKALFDQQEAERVKQHNEAEDQAVAEDLENMRNELNEYNAAKKEYEDAVAKEEEVYEHVVEYNDSIKDKNDLIALENADLNKDVDTGAVENIGSVGELNSGVKIDQEILDILGTHETLAGMESTLMQWGAELEADERRNSNLGTVEYAAYVALVEQYNKAVDEHNEKIAAYNNAVAAYNDAVDAFNTGREETPDSSTSNGLDEGDADWGNIKISSKDRWGRVTMKTFGHLHVKYQAAASKDKITNADGSVTYTNTVTEYEVVGVYPNKDAATTDPDDYGVTYDNDGAGDADPGVASMYKDAYNNEFGSNVNIWNSPIAINPDTGTVSFYVTLKDSAGEIHDLEVELDETTTYAEGSYYKAKTDVDQQGNIIFTDTMAAYRDSNNNALERVLIGGDWYYNISGKSVFVISALTCEGTSASGNSINIGNISGLDLVLNLQTMIQNHQAKNAQKILQNDYELGKTAYAEYREHKTYEEIYDPFSYDYYEPDYITPNEYQIQEYTRVEFDEENFVPTEYKEKPFVYDDYKPTEYIRKQYTPLKYEGPADPGHMDAPVETQRLEHVSLLDKLENLLHFVDPAPAPADPIVITSYDGGDEAPVAVRTTNLKKTVKIVDEKVPLAKAPNTGDLSGLWAVISGLSLGGITLLNKKRKEEE